METGERDPRSTGLSSPDGTGAEKVDAVLRRLLEPNPLAVERLVANALEGRGRGARPRAAIRWPRLAAAAAFVLALIFLYPDSPPTPPESDAPPIAAASPARISISNADGHVTISSTLGSKWILVTGDDS